MTSQDNSPSKEQQFKIRFATVLDDLQQNGTKDAETIWLIGSLAAELATKLGQTSWSAAKSVMTREMYDELLSAFDNQGNAKHAAGEIKHAYAIQALAVSLVSGTQRADAAMAEGEKLLDAMIDHCVTTFLNATKPEPIAH